jgi:hypothetical protein
MPINAVFVLQVFSTIESLLLGYRPKSTRRPELAEFKIIMLVFLEPWNPHLNKDRASSSGDNQSQMLNIKKLRNLYMAVLLLGQVNC